MSSQQISKSISPKSRTADLKQASSDVHAVLPIRVRLYHDFERPRNGRVYLTLRDSTRNRKEAVQGLFPVSSEDIMRHIRGKYDERRYTPYVYEHKLRSMTSLAVDRPQHEYLAEQTEDEKQNGLPPRIDIKLVSVESANLEEQNQSQAHCNQDQTEENGKCVTLPRIVHDGKPKLSEIADSLICDSSSTTLTGSWFGIGIIRGKTASNHGTLWRSALQFGASLTFTIGKRYEKKTEGSADVFKTHRQIPCIGYEDVGSFMSNAPIDAQIVVVEYGGVDLCDFVHPKRALYVLGSEDCGVPPALVARAPCHVSIPTAEDRPASLNVAAAGAIILYDRHSKMLSAKRSKKTDKANESGS